MGNKKKTAVMKITALVSTAAVIFVNALAVLLPLGGLSPSQVADLYPNLLASAGYAFSIWGVICLLLTVYTVWQLVTKTAQQSLTYKINVLLSASSAANVLWIFAWHFRLIPLSMLFMLLILASLIFIARAVAAGDLTVREKFFIKLPFAIYFGWITVAAIANAAVLLVSLGMASTTSSGESLAILALTGGAILAMWIGIHFRSAAYLLAVIWAYAGILVRHTASGGFNMQFPRVVNAVVACLVLLAGALAVEIIDTVMEKMKKPRKKIGGDL